jgi:hypothetical protein
MRFVTSCLVLALVTSPAFASGSQPAAPPSGAADSTRPGPEHAKLATLEGHWTTVYHVMPAPGMKPMDLPGSADFRVILGGEWIEGDTELRMGEKKVMGRAMYGFDRFKQRYVFLFVQESDTQPLFGYGVPDETGARITFTVPMDVPMAGRSAVPMRTVLDLSGPGRVHFEMNAPMPDGSEYQPLAIDYVREK